MRSVFYPPAQAYLCYHYISGTKPTHVYLAGLGLGSTGYYPSLIYGSSLAAYHTLTPDFLGFGYSEKADAFGYTVDEHADTIAFLLDKLQVSHCTVVGHSFGGAAAIVLATKRPDLVGRLVLAEAVLDAGDWFGAAAQSEEQWIAGGYAPVLEGTRKMLAEYTESDLSWWPMEKSAIPSFPFYRTACSLARDPHPTWREQLYQLTIPRLFFLGEVSLETKSVRVEEKDELPAHGIHVVILPKAEHMNLVSTSPSAFVRAITEFEAHDWISV
jgi:pimeloyl-ACP methyl ester carboxylesterase